MLLLIIKCALFHFFFYSLRIISRLVDPYEHVRLVLTILNINWRHGLRDLSGLFFLCNFLIVNTITLYEGGRCKFKK